MDTERFIQGLSSMTGENNSWLILKPHPRFGNRNLDEIPGTNFSYIKPQVPLRNRDKQNLHQY